MSLDTLANVKARLGVTTSADDTLLGLLQNSADKWVSNYCGRDFGGGTYTESHPGGSEFVHLKNFPVQSIHQRQRRSGLRLRRRHRRQPDGIRGSPGARACSSRWSVRSRRTRSGRG